MPELRGAAPEARASVTDGAALETQAPIPWLREAAVEAQAPVTGERLETS